jgi:hypothetical protein
MKKILVVLLVLAVAGGVFAQQGNWSVGGGAKVGTIVDFEPSDATVGANGDGDWNNKGSLDLGYDVGNGLKVSIGFAVEVNGYGGEKANGISLAAEKNADNYAAKVSSNLMKLFSGYASNAAYSNVIDSLWGYYKMLGGMVHLEAAYRGRDNGWWGSDDTYGGGWANLNEMSGILTNVEIQNLQFGIQVPHIFDFDSIGTPWTFVDEALLKSVVGFKFSMQPIEFAAQFKFEDSEVYFGGKWFIVPDVLTLGLNFKGSMASGGDVGAGASVSYSQDVFGAGVALKYQVKDASWLEINPNFWYNVIPDYFYFKTELGFHFEDDDITWSITPQIAWNFLGTGAGDYPGLNTGIGAKFNLASSGTSTLFVGFKWGF